jgi:hypothetical protein
MNNEEQILLALNKLIDLQEQTVSLHRQTIENQQKAIAQAQKAVANQFSTGRIYRISLAVLGVVLGFFILKLTFLK